MGGVSLPDVKTLSCSQEDDVVLVRSMEQNRESRNGPSTYAWLIFDESTTVSQRSEKKKKTCRTNDAAAIGPWQEK